MSPRQETVCPRSVSSGRRRVWRQPERHRPPVKRKNVRPPDLALSSIQKPLESIKNEVEPEFEVGAFIVAGVHRILDYHQAWLTPVSIAVFGGRLEPSELRFPDNNPAMRNMPATDLRDWDAIRVWANTLPEAFGLAQSSGD